jgi:hypothetical protein
MLIIGLVPEQSTFQQAHRYELLAVYLARLAAADSDVANDQLIIARIADVPECGLAVRNDLEAELKEKRGNSVMRMHEGREGIKRLGISACGSLSRPGRAKFRRYPGT